MSYSVVTNDIVDVDQLIERIKLYAKKFQAYNESFIHYKNVEKFERNLEANVPNLKHQITEIYSSGRDLAIAVPSHIYECLTIERTSLLKTGIDKLESEMIGLKSWAESEHAKVNKVYKASGYNEWSVNRMLADTLEMCGQMEEILILIDIIKNSYSYQIQSKQITTAEIRDSMRAKMNTTNNSGNFQNSQISSGDSSTNTMTVNQSSNEEIAVICQKLIEVIDQSEAKQEEKEAVRRIVQEIKGSQNQSDLKNAYNKLISSISSHITIGSAILSSSILPVLNNLIM